MATSVLPDLPTTKDHLDFEASAATLAGIIGDKNTATPITVGVFGTWGTGKTSLMRMIEVALVRQSRHRRGLKAHTIWFDAWKYDKERELWRAFLMRVLEATRAVAEGRPTSEHDGLPIGEKSPYADYTDEERKKIIQTLDDMAASLYRDVDREELGRVEIDPTGLLKAGAKFATRIVLPFVPGAGVLAEFVKAAQGEAAKGTLDAIFDAVQRQKTAVHRDQVRFLAQFQHNFQTLITDYIVKYKRRLVIFVDDLDRCLPEKAIEVLEAIKLFLDVEGCVFVIGVDRKVIERGIQVKYRELQRALGAEGDERGEAGQLPIISGADYLEKIVQLPFILPPVEVDQVTTFIRETVQQFPEDDGRCVDVFALGVERNPRKIKRCLNVFLLLWSLALKRGKAPGVIRPVLLAKVVVIQQRHSDLYQLLIEEPERLARLEAYFREEQRREQGQAALRANLEARAALAGQELPEAALQAATRARIEKALEPFTARHALHQLLTLHDEGETDANFTDVPPEQLGDYIYLTRATAESPPEPERKVAIPIPEMVVVPAGPFTMGTRREDIPALVEKYGGETEWYEDEVPQRKVNLPAFEIGRYPVTNREYQPFVRGAGYRPPGGWDGDEYPPGKGNHPVVYVSWRDAVAYCRWLSEQTGRSFRLPTEAEWEKAARGSDGRQYPWGNEFDPAKCNTSEGGPGHTTLVGQYPDGASPYGVLDMAGNVWEWCSSLYGPYPYDAGDGRENLEAGALRVLRGGAFGSGAGFVRCACRSRNFPDYRGGDGGFRVVVASPVHL